MAKTIPQLRWYIAVLLCLASELNYLDRQVLSVLAQTIQDELKISTVEYSRITSAFLVSYTVMYAVSGRLVDYLGTRKSFTIFLSAWSVVNMLNAFARTAGHFAFFRFLLGAAEPANFPAGVRAVSEWFPMRERALAVGIFNAGTAIGAAVAAPLVSFIALTWGWRAAFVVTGGLGFVWILVWLLFYRLPQDHPLLSEDERRLILGERAPVQSTAMVPLRKLLSMRETWGCVAARFLTDPISYFLAFWIPKYLQQERGFSLAEVGKYGWIPFAAQALGNFFAGGMPRYLISRGWSLNRARKTTMFVVSCLMPFCYLAVTRVDGAAWALAVVALCTFGHAAWGNIILPAEVFPQRAVGTVSGFGGCLGGVAGIISQLTIGWVVQHLSFAPIFAACSMIYLLAFGIVHWLIGELGVIREVE